ncbi:MAG: glycosyltransferase, partial [Chloroflexota bacterium]
FMMGQYVSRIYDEVRDRPLYVVAKAHGFRDNDDTQVENTAVRSTDEL